MSRSLQPQMIGATSFVASLLGHLLVVGAGAWLVSMRLGAGAPVSASTLAPADEVAVDVAPLNLPTVHFGPALGEASAEEPFPTDEVEPGGGEPFARPDMDRRGRGGSQRVDSAALNLADRDDGLTLTRELSSRIDRDQIQRLDTSKDRASHEDRRATTHPMDLVFIATGSGHVAERRPSADSNPSRGALRAPRAGVLGSMVGGPALGSGEFEPARNPGGGNPGGDRKSPGPGVLQGTPGRDHRTSAAVAMGRPLVIEGPPSIPAEQSGRPRDTVDSEQEVAATVQSLVHASTAGGVPAGGSGGEEGSGPTGSGGEAGPGSRAAPFGGGSGPFSGLSDADPRISAYRRSVMAKIHPLWANAFPKAASLEGKQGRAIVSLVIYSDGHVDQVRVARASGVPEFDENVRSAVIHAAPFAPFPPSIPGPSMRWNITFDMTNPVVR
ncbi:MAG TPA: energy transducer TonB [Polyangiaceae bacterium]